MIAIKYCNDFYYDNLMFSRIGGVTLLQLNRLEREFLYFINYNLYYTEELYYEWIKNIECGFYLITMTWFFLYFMNFILLKLFDLWFFFEWSRKN